MDVQLDKVVKSILRRQVRNLNAYWDYVLIFGFQKKTSIPSLILKTRGENILYTTIAKNDMLYVIKELFNQGKMGELLYSQIDEQIRNANQGILRSRSLKIFN